MITNDKAQDGMDEVTEAGAREAMAKAQERARQDRLEVLKKIDPKLPEKVEEWKKRFSTVHLESTHILDQLYIYRGLRRDEYISIIRQNKDRHDTDEMISSKGTLYPEVGSTEWITKEAGVPFTLSELIMAASGFGPSDPTPVRL